MQNARSTAVTVRVKRPCFTLGSSLFGVVSSSWRSPRRHCPAQRTPSCSRTCGTSIFVLGNGLRAFELLPAFLATILVGRHELESSDKSGGSRSSRWRSLPEGSAFGRRSLLQHQPDHTQPLVMPECAATALTTKTAVGFAACASRPTGHSSSRYSAATGSPSKVSSRPVATVLATTSWLSISCRL